MPPILQAPVLGDPGISPCEYSIAATSIIWCYFLSFQNTVYKYTTDRIIDTENTEVRHYSAVILKNKLNHHTSKSAFGDETFPLNPIGICSGCLDKEGNTDTHRTSPTSDPLCSDHHALAQCYEQVVGSLPGNATVRVETRDIPIYKPGQLRHYYKSLSECGAEYPEGLWCHYGCDQKRRTL